MPKTKICAGEDHEVTLREAFVQGARINLRLWAGDPDAAAQFAAGAEAAAREIARTSGRQ